MADSCGGRGLPHLSAPKGSLEPYPGKGTVCSAGVCRSAALKQQQQQGYRKARAHLGWRQQWACPALRPVPQITWGHSPQRSLSRATRAPVAAKELFQGYSMCDASSHGAGASFNHQLHPLNGPLWLRISKSGLQGESPRIL